MVTSGIPLSKFSGELFNLGLKWFNLLSEDCVI